jgi:hypothetical protein
VQPCHWPWSVWPTSECRFHVPSRALQSRECSRQDHTPATHSSMYNSLSITAVSNSGATCASPIEFGPRERFDGVPPGANSSLLRFNALAFGNRLSPRAVSLCMKDDNHQFILGDYEKGGRSDAALRLRPSDRCRPITNVPGQYRDLNVWILESRQLID